jgi:hypothetical protein
MICSGGVARFIDTVATAFLHRTSKKRKGDDGCHAAKNRRKQREEPGACAKKAKDAYFISQHRL